MPLPPRISASTALREAVSRVREVEKVIDRNDVDEFPRAQTLAAQASALASIAAATKALDDD